MNPEKKTQPAAIKEIIAGFLKQEEKHKDSEQAVILRNWKKIVPKRAQDCARPVAIKNKVLVVAVSNSAWLHQLAMNKDRLLKKIKKLIPKGQISDMRFKIGK